jgi:hypothetical protein
VFEEMEPQDGELLLGREALSGLLGHGSTSARSCSLFEQTVCPISTEARQLDMNANHSVRCGSPLSHVRLNQLAISVLLLTPVVMFSAYFCTFSKYFVVSPGALTTASARGTLLALLDPCADLTEFQLPGNRGVLGGAQSAATVGLRPSAIRI